MSRSHQILLEEASIAMLLDFWNHFFFLICWWIFKKSSYRLCPILLFSAPTFRLALFFTMCTEGERPATPLCWVALNEKKKRRRKILAGTSPNEQINASVPQEKAQSGRKEWDAIGTPKTRPKHSHRSSYHMLWIGAFLNLAQQYISPEPFIETSCN